MVWLMTTINNIIKEGQMSKYLFVSDVARFLGVRPRDVSDLFYQRRLSDEQCPVVGGRRLIPREFVPTIADALRARREGGGQ
jgi:hypothetical protein